MTEGRRHLPRNPPGAPYSSPSYRNPSSWNPATWGSPGGPWGDAHLALDAIVAYVDDELSPGARSRATEHLTRCRDCVREVVAQLQARSALRSATAPTLPVSLLATLRSIPQDAELPPPPPGLAVGPDGTFVSVQRGPAPGHQLAGQPCPPLPAQLRPPQQGRPQAGPARSGPTQPGASLRPPSPAWVRLGASAVAGVALGALMAGAMPFHSGTPSAPGGGPSGVLDARLQLGSVDSVQLRREPSVIPTTPSSTGPSTQPPPR